MTTKKAVNSLLAFLVLSLSYIGLAQASMHEGRMKDDMHGKHMKDDRQWCRQNFQECKDRMIKRLEAREQRIRELKECIMNAQDFESMSQCKRKQKGT